MMTEDLSFFFTDFAKDVVFGTSTFKGILDAPGVDDHGMAFTEYSLLIQTSDLSTMAEDSQVTIDGVDYEVRGEPKPITDGKLTRLLLAKI